MGHRRFVQEKQKPIEHSYSRTPNPQARNYFNEMAPVNGIVEYEQTDYEAANREREAMRDAISKRMGELLLRGVTMLDAYCQICNGILMEDRNGQRTCVACEFYAEKVGQPDLETSKEIAQLGEDDEPIREMTEAVISTQKTVKFKADKGPSKSVPHDPKSSKLQSFPLSIQHKSSLVTSNSPIVLPGYAAAIRAIDDKLAWAAQRLTTSTDLNESRELLALMSEAMVIFKTI